MRRPLAVLALCFVAGTAVGLCDLGVAVSRPAMFFLTLAVWILAVLFLWLRRQYAAHCFALLVVFACGVLSAQLPRGGTSLAAILPLDPLARVQATVSGVIVAEPEPDAGSPIRMLLQVQQVEVDGNSLQVQETMPLLVYGSYRWPPRRWDHWSFTGTLQYTPESYRGDWLFVTGVRNAKRIGPPTTVLGVWAEQLRRLAAETLQAGIANRPDRYGVLHALLLGYRARLPVDVQQAFRRTGTMHIFAISGLHVGILCAVLVFVINLLRVPRTCRVLALAPVILLYAFMTGARASAVRAGVMAITYLAAPLCGRRSDPWSALALAGVVILGWRPDQLQDPGFIFSFTAVAGILAFVPLVDAWLQQHVGQDPFAKRDQGLGPGSSALLWLGRLVAVSVAAWVSTTPLSLYYFGRFTPVALLANLIVLPLAFLIVVTGCLAFVAAATGGAGFAVLFNQANYAYVGWLNGGMLLLERVPWGYRENVPFPLWGVIVWYAILLLAAYMLRLQSCSSTSAGPMAVGL